MKLINYILLTLIILIISLFFVSSSNENEKIGREVYEKLEKSNETRVIIKLKEPSQEKEFLVKAKKTDEEIALEKQATKEEIINDLGEENIKHVFDEEISVEISKDDLDELNKNPDIELITIPKKIHAFLQQSVPYINASLVWPIQISNVNITGIDETVCIIDTGINFSHPALLGKNKTCIIDCFGKACVKNCSIGDDNGHGTHVAGIVAASGEINGVGINVNLIGVKVLDSDGNGGDDDLNAGIDWCIANRDAYNISVISMSLGDCSNHSTYCNDFSSASFINNATAYNISVIAAAGNGPGGSCGNTITNINGPAAPACVENATAVGAINDADSSISYQRGALFELLAPGININSTVPIGSCELCTSSGYKVVSGTSMATPHVAGAFALINQFYRLQSNRVLTPAEIKTTLNNTGKQINDSSGTGLNFSRIDIYSAITSLDEIAPSVNLISPANGTSTNSQNQTFSCNASDAVGLKNITLQIWDSLELYYNETQNASGTFAEEEFNKTLDFGDYKWNCLAYDSNNNSAYAGSNFSLYIGNLSSSLIYPLNNGFTNQNQTFNCSATTTSTKQLKNLTFYLWTATTLIYNSTKDISGTQNETNFQHNFTQEQEYEWNCLVYNNETESAFANSNYTLTYDITKPNITLQSPENSASYSSNSQQITFQYNVSDVAIANCSLIINNAASLTNSSITNLSVTQTFTQTFTPSSYAWQINCTDSAGNQENSTSRSFTITQVDDDGGGGGGGGGGGATTYFPTAQEMLNKYTKELKKGDKINFSINKESHILIATYIGKNYVNLTLQSSILNLVLNAGQSLKLNLTSPDYYGLLLKLNLIKDNKANMTIQQIYEEIPKKAIEKNITIITSTESQQTKQENEKESYLKYIILISVVAIIIIAAIILIYFVASRRKHEKHKAKP